MEKAANTQQTDVTGSLFCLKNLSSYNWEDNKNKGYFIFLCLYNMSHLTSLALTCLFSKREELRLNS